MAERRAFETLRGPGRHELPVIDDLGMAAARHADRLLGAARARANEHWVTYLAPLPDHLRDADLVGLRTTAQQARSAYGTKDSIRDALPAELTEPFLEAIDRLLRELNRERHRARG